jgi:hypothetical protein
MAAPRPAGRSVGGPKSSNHHRTAVCRVHETQNAKTKCSQQLCLLPGRAHPKHLSQDQAQIEGGSVNQQALGNVILAAQVHPAHAARVVRMGEASLHSFPATSHQRLGGPGLGPPPVGTHRRLRSGSAISVRTPTSAKSSNTCLLWYPLSATTCSTPTPLTFFTGPAASARAPPALPSPAGL